MVKIYQLRKKDSHLVINGRIFWEKRNVPIILSMDYEVKFWCQWVKQNPLLIDLVTVFNELVPSRMIALINSSNKLDSQILDSCVLFDVLSSHTTNPFPRLAWNPANDHSDPGRFKISFMLIIQFLINE